MTSRKVMIDQLKQIQADLIRQGNDILLNGIPCPVNNDRSLAFIELIKYIDFRIDQLEMESES